MTIEYWQTRKATGENGHLAYLGMKEEERLRSAWLVERVGSLYNPKDKPSILELGCGCGRNMWYLLKAGYTDLQGIEVNTERATIAAMTTGCTIRPGNIEWGIKFIDTVDLVYTMAVLEHVESDEVIEQVADIKARHFITIEGENKKPSSRHFPRNYRDIMTRHGWHERKCWDIVPGLGAGCYVGRVFVRGGDGMTG